MTRRAPRRLEAIIAKTVNAAAHLGELDEPYVQVTKLQARKIDDRVHALEQRAAAGQAPALFADPCPICGVVEGPCLSKRDSKPIKTKHAGRNAQTVGALAKEEGGLTYDLDVLGRMLDDLGLSPKGRKDLALSVGDDDNDDALTAAVAQLRPA